MGGKLRVSVCGIPGDVGKGKGMLQLCSLSMLGRRLGDWIWGNREEKVYRQHSWFSGRYGLWFTGCICLILGLGYSDKLEEL